MKKKFLGIIPARKGSKRLLNKNNRKIGKISLTEKTIRSALKCKMLNAIAISSDDNKVLKTASKFPNIKYIKRPKKLANSTAKLTDVCKHVIKKITENFDYCVLLQVTSPLRTPKHIDQAIKKVLKNKALGLISVTTSKNDEKNYYHIRNSHIYKCQVDKKIVSKKYQFNGSIFIMKTSYLKKKNLLFTNGKILPFIMSNNLSIDIDYLSDLQKARMLDK
jgi:CMP-N,N'-diacetyllegionaminic acid synthase